MATLVHASWNGATEVSDWRVYATNRAGTMQSATSVATQPRSGFETTLRLDGFVAYVIAEALDINGNILGRSSVACTQCGSKPPGDVVPLLSSAPTGWSRYAGETDREPSPPSFGGPPRIAILEGGLRGITHEWTTRACAIASDRVYMVFGGVAGVLMAAVLVRRRLRRRRRRSSSAAEPKGGYGLLSQGTRS